MMWIEDGIAYSSIGETGYLVDVGNGIAGGSPSNPVVETMIMLVVLIMQHFLQK